MFGNKGAGTTRCDFITAANQKDVVDADEHDQAHCSRITDVGFSTTRWAGFAEGLAAYEPGDFATALQEWRPLAEQGHAKAQIRQSPKNSACLRQQHPGLHDTCGIDRNRGVFLKHTL